ncbi:MAG: hypothetical protein CBD97_01095 [Pelagibacteraceae bacterium TMED237]|nr:cAMP-binding protein [Candidatus Neomarinimicrobiota bacterium]OUW96662.1 MAG: hypothetical protein CBD97_01095 [Pelagibacteraceae bacterium TMED237]|tara:strand:- start:8187 stop:8696 length:510 start_codon:yes stop_codon:yes gene_type:complete
MSHPIWSNIFKSIYGESQTEITIKKIPIFENLNRRELREISKIVHKRDFLEDEYVFRNNTPGLGMYIILKGKIKIEGQDGTEFAVLENGDFFGETALINEDKRSANAKALEDTQIVAFFRSDLLEIIRRNPVFGTKILFNLCKTITVRLKKTNNLLEQNNSSYHESQFH